MAAETQPVLSIETQLHAGYIAMVIRNAMEDFHCQHLNDEQMKELNPIIRNAVATALHAFDHFERAPAAHRYVDYHLRSIPPYWEPAELLAGYVKMWERDKAGESKTTN
jgi:hypothetical protein